MGKLQNSAIFLLSSTFHVKLLFIINENSNIVFITGPPSGRGKVGWSDFVVFLSLDAWELWTRLHRLQEKGGETPFSLLPSTADFQAISVHS